MTTRLIASLTAAILLIGVGTGWTGHRDADDKSLQRFKSDVRTYAALHRRMERTLPPLRITEKAHEIAELSDALAAAIQIARAKAREGDLFTLAVSANFRARIADALTSRHLLPEDVISESVSEAPADAPMPYVNGRFPWARGAATWPCIIEALPSLPDELQYHIVGRDLVLVDTHAGLVVDILRNAIR